MNLFNTSKKKEKTLIDEKEQEELKLVTDMHTKFLDARNTKQVKSAMWDNCINAYDSKYYEDNTLPDYKSNQVSNYIFSTVETIKPIMVDNDPKIIIMPKTKKGLEVTEKIQDLFSTEWKRAKMGIKLIQAVTLSLQIGTAVWFIPWKADDENGLGNATPILVNPYNIFPDPMATSTDNAEYIIYATYKHVNTLKQRYPSKANLLESGMIKYPELVSLGGNQDVAKVNNQILVLECYVRDFTTIEFQEIEEGRKVTKTKKKYPNGRVITIAPEINLLLEDKINSYKDSNPFPFVFQKNYDVPFEFWGKGEIEQLLSPQQYINELSNQIIDNAKLTANMPWVIDKNSGIGKGQLTNRPGLIIRKNPGSEVGRQTPPQMPQYVRESIEILKNDIEMISGIHDVTQGKKPGSVSAASAIIALQEAGEARVRLKVKMMEYALMELGNMWYNRIRQYWLTTREVKRTDKNNKIDFIEINPEDLKEEQDFIIEAGSTMPVNKNAMLDLMIRLSQTTAEDGLPMVDRETVLAYTNVPDKKKIVDRFTEMSGIAKQEEEARMQAEQQAMMEQQSQTNAQEIAKQQMLSEHQNQLTSKQAQEQAELSNMQVAHEAEIEQVKNVNQAVTDEQLQQVMEIIRNNPELLNQLMQPQETSNPQGLV